MPDYHCIFRYSGSDGDEGRADAGNGTSCSADQYRICGRYPEDINDLVTTKQEDAITSLDGVKNVYSFSQENVSIIMVEYEFGTNIDTAYINLKKAIDGTKRDMPEDVEDPNILEMDMNASPVMTLAVGGQVDGNLYTYVENNVQPELEKLSSVGEVSLAGGQKEYVSVCLDPEKMAQYNLSLSTIGQLVGAADFAIPAGDVNVGKQELNVSAGNDYDDVESLNNVAIPLADGNVIHLSDIATVSQTLEEENSIGRYNGKDVVSIAIKKQQSSTAIDVSRQVTKQIEKLKAANPGLEFTVVNDSSDMINESIVNVYQTMFMAIILSMFILVAVLRRSACFRYRWYFHSYFHYADPDRHELYGILPERYFTDVSGSGRRYDGR